MERMFLQHHDTKRMAIRPHPGSLIKQDFISAVILHAK